MAASRWAGQQLPATLAFVAGFVDTLGFIALFGLFTAHVTGNFVLIGSALLGLQVLLLAGFALCGWAASPIVSDTAPLSIWAGLLGAAAMGVQNAAARLLGPILAFAAGAIAGAFGYVQLGFLALLAPLALLLWLAYGAGGKAAPV